MAEGHAGGESKEGERLFESVGGGLKRRSPSKGVLLFGFLPPFFVRAKNGAAEQRNLRKAQGISRTTQKVSTYSKRNSLHFKKFTSKVVNFLISSCLLRKLIL